MPSFFSGTVVQLRGPVLRHGLCPWALRYRTTEATCSSQTPIMAGFEPPHGVDRPRASNGMMIKRFWFDAIPPPEALIRCRCEVFTS